MEWLVSLFNAEAASYSAVAESLLVLSLVTSLGLAIGNFRICRISIGVTGVLFAGLAAAHFGLNIDEHILEFVREFGLILFVYTIGMQVGPSLSGSFRREGLRLNVLAIAIIILGTVIAIGIHFWASVDTPAAAGLLAGATTNTPSLAAVQQVLRESTKTELRNLPGLAYAVSYPFGVLGLILTMLLIRFLFRIRIADEKQAFFQDEAEHRIHVGIMNLEVQNPNLDGLLVRNIPIAADAGVVISRIMHDGVVNLAQPDMTLHLGDILLCVGPEEELRKLQIVIGHESQVDLTEVKSDLVWKWLIVTKKAAIGKSVQELNLRQRIGVNIARISRADIELPVSSGVRLQFGDRLSVVGTEEALVRAADELGNAPKELNHPMMVPLFVGISIGVLLGSYPFHLPGLPIPMKLGLAGGPLLVAIVLSRIGRIGPLVWYLPVSANYTLREIGISLFLACVGLRAGDQFVSTLVHGDGLKWMMLAMCITFIPPLLVACIGRIFLKLNYLTLCGLLAGSMTDPPALAYVTNATDSEAPSIGYATVYPLTMIMRVLLAQIVIIYL